LVTCSATAQGGIPLPQHIVSRHVLGLSELLHSMKLCRCWMLSKRLVFVRALGAALLVCAAAGSGQTTVNPNAKACQLLSVPELEAHFGGKAISVRGSDTSTVSMCSVRVKDMRHEATAQLNAPSPPARRSRPSSGSSFSPTAGSNCRRQRCSAPSGASKPARP
jgi:hypothetical protein